MTHAAFQSQGRARFEPSVRVEFAEGLPVHRGVRCVQKNTFLHIEAEPESPARRPRCMSDMTHLSTAARSPGTPVREEDERSTSTVDESLPAGQRSRLESLDEWPGPETPQFTAFLAQAPPEFSLPSAAGPLQATPEERPRKKKEAPTRRADVTVMLRNIPNKYTQDVLLEELAPHLQSVDFFYLPIDFRNQCNLGYAFLNFKDGSAATQFQASFDGGRLARYPQSPKVLQVHLARVQGLQANVKRLRNSSVMGMLTDDCKPVLFDGGSMRPLAHGPASGARRGGGRTRAR